MRSVMSSDGVSGWVNDEDTKRAYGTEDDAYRVFSKILAAGCPPADWNALIKECHAASARTSELNTLLTDMLG